jgi:outer membrane protein OmpA-like peptidoglycan-associated protein
MIARMNPLSARAPLALAAFCAVFGTCGGAAALTLPPGAVRSAATTEAPSALAVATGPYDGATVPTLTAEGTVVRTAWRLPDSSRTTLDLLSGLRAQLAADGYATLFECDALACGGFDFRYLTDVLPEPEMHVDLGDFRYLAASRKAAGGMAYTVLLVSRSSANGFVQVTEVLPPGEVPAALPPEPAEPPVATAPTPPDPRVPAAAGDFVTTLEQAGSVALEDLVFPSGSSTLAAGSFASLQDTADYLAAHPDRRITLVGHTDATGALDANITLSRRRAQSVRDRLVRDYGVAAAQVSADGVGFLAPRASNLTDEGRTRNRRVEAMMTSTR